MPSEEREGGKGREKIHPRIPQSGEDFFLINQGVCDISSERSHGAHTRDMHVAACPRRRESRLTRLVAVVSRVNSCVSGVWTNLPDFFIYGG